MSTDRHINEQASIVLTGFMGTGKSTVGRLVADVLGVAFVDTDVVIEERHGPIPVIFERDGEEGFRALERALAEELAADPTPRVIATGGRMMLDPANVDALAPVATILCLTADPDDLIDRLLAADEHRGRPLLAGPDPAGRIRELLEERATAYARFPQVDAGRAPGDVAADILARAAFRPDRTAPDLSGERRPPR